MELRPYQIEALKASAEAEARGVTRQLWVLATGLGKTVMVGAHIARRGLPRTFGFMHRDELIEQAAEKLAIFNPGARIGVEKASEMADPDTDQIVLASVQTVGRKDGKRLGRFPSDWPKYLWLDEAHHAPASSNLEVLNHFGFYGDCPRRDVLLLGTTATPDRLDEMGYDKIFDDVVYRYGLREAIRDKWLADVRAWRMKSDIDLAGVRVSKGEFMEKDLELAIDESRMKEVALEAWASRCRGRRSLFFCVTKKHAHEMAEEIGRRGGKAAVVVDDTPKAERKAIVDAFRKGEIEALINVQVATEGWDIPEIECVHILRPTRSRALYAQCLGRGTRKTATKEFVELYDYTDQMHDVCSVGQIFGLPDSWELKGQSVEDEARQVEQAEADLGLKADGARGMRDLLGRIRERKIDMIRSTIEDDSLPSKLAWIKPSAKQERWLISWRNETREKLDKIPGSSRGRAEKLIESMNLWGVHERIEVFRNELGAYEARLHRSGPEGSNTQEGRLDADRSLAKLVSRLDRLVADRRPHKARLLLKSAPWRRQPVSDAQREILERKGVPKDVALTLTKGDATTLINTPNKLVRKWFAPEDTNYVPK